MKCDCKYVTPELLYLIETGLFENRYRGNRQRLDEALAGLAKDCKFEKVNQDWVRFPKQQATLDYIGTHSILHEHSDGDLTVDSKNFGIAVITTDGEIFVEMKRE